MRTAQRLVTVAALGLAPLASTSTAYASDYGTAGVTATERLVYTAVPGISNQVVVSVRWNDAKDKLIYLLDDSTRIKAGDTCTYPRPDDQTRVRCVVTPPKNTDPYSTLMMNLGDGDDRVWYTNNTKQTYYFSKFALGPGSDTFEGTLSGGLDGSVVLGQGGEDDIKSGPRSSALGGNGNDMLTVFGKHSAAVGGKGDDQIWGATGRQFLLGGDGDDQIRGGLGNDDIWGESGDDKLWGEGGNDRIWGGDGDDWIWGGPGKDVLRGGPGKDEVKP